MGRRQSLGLRLYRRICYRFSNACTWARGGFRAGIVESTCTQQWAFVLGIKARHDGFCHFCKALRIKGFDGYLLGDA